MDNGALLNYALKRRNFLAAMWLMLQQRWYVRSFGSSARGLSWMIIVLGMALVTFTVVTIARNVVPVLTTPGTGPYFLLQSLVLVVSFNIYLNYFCATAFSRRVGKAPADYVYRDPYEADPAVLPLDDSDESESEEEENDDEDGEDFGAAVRGDVHPLPHTQPHFQPRQHRQVGVAMKGADESEAAGSQSAAQTVSGSSPHPRAGGPLLASTGTSLRKSAPATTASAPKGFRGIQVVRVFGEAPPPSPAKSSSALSDGAQQSAAAVPQRTSAFSSAHDVLLVDDVMEEEAEDEEPGEAERGRVAAGPAWPLSASTRLGRCVGLCWGRLFPAARGTRPRHTLARTRSRRCSRLSSVSCCDAPSSTVATTSVLRELEALAYAAERFGPRQRAVRVLDAPRRYCSHCRRLKAPREHHCAICNECVAKMDHHCPWINNCVDAENQRYFILFISWLWLGTFLASAFIGYGVTRQHRYTTRREVLYKQWLRYPVKVTLARELQSLRMPYGPSGVLLTSYPTIMVLGIAITMFLCMSLFIFFNRRLILENTTVIESIYVDEKRRHVYRSTGYTYRNPYDLGRWLNFLDMFSPAGDPFVTVATENLQGHGASSTALPGSPGAHPRGLLSRLKTAASRVGVVLWLIAFPTFRSAHSDGVHYTTFDALVSGEQTSLLRS